MSGTVMGGKSAAETNRQRHGEDFYSVIGRIGGSKGTGHAFAHGGISAAEAGRIGGKLGSRAGIKNGFGKTAKTLKRYRDKARAEAHRDFQSGFNETPTLYQRMTGKR